ncbi:M1 family metallopeptidase [Flavobacteriaceae bacterium]|nr:M1 family metallopeptidase [Flavobacteriaceae bacterium]
MKILFYLFFSLPCVLLSQSNWQQNADYEMSVDIDVESFRFKGSQEVLYTNNSPDTISKVYYHLYFNAFKPGSQMDVRSLNISDPDSRVKDRISKLEKNEEGDLSVFELKQDGKPVFFEQQETVLLARLNKVLLPGKKTKLTLLFKGVVPKQIRRSGRNNKDGVALSMTQWYPKLAEYDFEGWHPNPYIAREFHGVWGNYDVKITIDKNYILGGTGYLQNSNEIGYGYHSKNKTINHSEKEKLTWHFFAPNVHDFTWAADPDFIHDVVKGPNDVDLHFLYKTNQENWRKLQPHSVGLMKYFNENIGEYPWKQYSIIQGGDGGMEYAMSTLITGGEQYSRLLGTTSHEMAHAWFQHILANNEAKHAWMDEGFASYIDVLAENSVLGKTPKNPFKRSYDSYRRLANSGLEQPQTTHSDRYNYNFAYSVSAYSKGSVFLSQLSYIVGPKTLKKILKRYFNEFKFKHPTPNDFKRVAEKVSDLELEWYLNDWTRTAEKIDYAVTYLEGKVVLERKGLIPMPIELVVTFRDETKKHYYIPTDLMRGIKKELSSSFETLPVWGWASPFYSFPLQKEVVKIEIDPSGLLADVDLKNNIYKL